MRLITGGAYQGKLVYALELCGMKEKDMIDGSECSISDLLEKPLVNHFHSWIKKMLQEEKDIKDINEILDQILIKNPDIVIVVDELGCGIVPVESFDRTFREITGRICCRLAKEAQEVHRVICGLGTVIWHA